MRLFTMFLLATLVASSASAASYQKTDGTIVDPIMKLFYGTGPGGLYFPHVYSGKNLEPYADLAIAYLKQAFLDYANLSGADLSVADLSDAVLTDAYLGYSHLIHTNLQSADLTDAYLTGADLTGADLTYATFSTGTTLKDGQTVAQHGFDAAGLEAYLKADPVGASLADNLTIIPEPTTLLLALLALVAAPLRVRCG